MEMDHLGKDESRGLHDQDVEMDDLGKDESRCLHDQDVETDDAGEETSMTGMINDVEMEDAGKDELRTEMEIYFRTNKKSPIIHSKKKNPRGRKEKPTTTSTKRKKIIIPQTSTTTPWTSRRWPATLDHALVAPTSPETCSNREARPTTKRRSLPYWRRRLRLRGVVVY